jgi:hypothetical protein
VPAAVLPVSVAVTSRGRFRRSAAAFPLAAVDKLQDSIRRRTRRDPRPEMLSKMLNHVVIMVYSS